MSVDYAKLKTNLNLIMHRLKLVEKKKMELNQKARRTIGEFLVSGKVDRAKIRVEQIIREDYLIEAMDLVESYCDLLISRFGQLQSSEVVEEGLAPAISSIIWVTPRFGQDVPELKVIAEQLGKKYGKQYVLAVKDNQLKTVNETLMSKCGVQAPPRVLVEKYLVEIAKDQKIDYKPDPRVLKEQEVFNSTGFRPEDDDHNTSGGGGGGGGGGSRQTSQIAPQGGFNLIDLGDHYPRNPITRPYSPYDQAPPLPSEPPLGSTSLIGPSDTTTEPSDATAPSAQLPIGFNLSTLNATSTSSSSRDSANIEKKSNSSSSLKQGNTKQQESTNPTNNGEGPPPNYESVVNKPGQSNQTQYYSFGPDSSFAAHHRSKDDLNDTLPELPPVPKDVNDGPSTSQQDDSRLDFEDLTRRFEELRNKKN